MSLPLLILDQDISPLTSPWLGARPTSEIGYGGTGANGNRNGNGSAGSPTIPPSSSSHYQTTNTSSTAASTMNSNNK